jgi:hypothetical protein
MKINFKVYKMKTDEIQIEAVGYILLYNILYKRQAQKMERKSTWILQELAARFVIKAG